MSKNPAPLPKLVHISLWMILTIIVLLPFHAFFTTWASTAVGHLLLVRAWKEVLLIVVGGLLLVQAFRDPVMTKQIVKRRVNKTILFFTLLQLVLWAIFQPHFVEVVQGMIIDLRFLALFVFIQVPVYYGWRPDWKLLAKIVLIPATIVVIFGLLEVTILPRNFLSHFGYSKATIAPYLTVYQGSSVIRINSFLRGPNPLGAYLILPFTLLIAWFIKQRSDIKWWYGLWFIPAVVTLYYSQSRSAWLGLIVALGVLAWWGLPKIWRPKLIVAALAGLVVVVGVLFSLKNTYLVQNVVLHTASDHKTSETSNQGHLDSLQTGWKDVWNHPLGEGPGTAGPASVRDPKTVDITENFYLQIAQESGWIGLLLLLFILAEVFVVCYKGRQSVLPLALLASLAGISVANFLLPVWTDDTLSLLWWCLAGFVMGQWYAVSVLKTPKNQHQTLDH